MKAILEFTLPEESEEHRAAIDGAKWKSIVVDLAEKIRRDKKHRGGEPLEVMENLLAEIYELADHYGVILE